MTKGLVIALPGDVARLKRKVRAHFKRLGFLKAADGTLLPPNLDKQSYRDMHAHQRDSRLEANRAWIADRAGKLIQHFASGADLDVARISPRIEVVAFWHLAVEPLSLRKLLLEDSHLRGVWPASAVSGLG